MEEKKLTIKYAVLQGMYWMLAAVAMAYVTPLLEAKGFDSMEIGMLNAVKYTSVVVFQVLIASFSDKYAERVPLKYIIALLTVVSVGTAWVFWAVDMGFAGAVVIFILLGATINCISPLIDSLSIQYMNHGRKLNYTVSRACGSFTWAIFCVVVGVFADTFGVTHILLLQIGIAVLLLISNLVMDKVDFTWGKSASLLQERCTIQEIEAVPEKREFQVHTAGYLLRYFPKYVLFLVACMFTFMGYNLNATFMIDVVQNLGGSHTDYGVAQFVLAMAEIPTALVFMKMKKYISIDKLMVCCSLFCTLRAAATTFAPSVLVLVLSQSLELLGLGIFYAGSVFFVMENLPEGDVVKGVSLINVATVGIGEAIASLLCGSIKAAFGLQALMVTSIFVSLIGVFVMLVMLRAKRSVEKQTGSKAMANC